MNRSRSVGVLMDPRDEITDARAFLAAGDSGKALRLGWSAAQDALLRSDAEDLRAIAELADAIEAASSSRHAEEAHRLASYCRHSASGAAGEVESHDLLSRLGRMVRPRARCVHCSAPMSGNGRFCSNCGQPRV